MELEQERNKMVKITEEVQEVAKDMLESIYRYTELLYTISSSLEQPATHEINLTKKDILREFKVPTPTLKTKEVKGAIELQLKNYVTTRQNYIVAYESLSEYPEQVGYEMRGEIFYFDKKIETALHLLSYVTNKK